ncbi:head-tail connector protein [Wolbachia endosymbiont of Pentidionis agamae]|uniref:head-tail connector protein n=1 Tax=Wolbachia endosymbiont of Pentidionis agamae TaxID=3110435 RepID=UPI002FD23A40
MSYGPVIKRRSSAPKSFPITLEFMKSFLRIENNQDDELISNLLSIATDYAQWYMGISLIKQEWQISYAVNHVLRRKFGLVYGPIIKVESVEAVYRNQSAKPLSQKNYHVDLVAPYIQFDQLFNVSRIDIVYKAGYENSDLIPAQIKQGIANHVANAYRNRETETNTYLSGIKSVYAPFCELKVVL